VATRSRREAAVGADTVRTWQGSMMQGIDTAHMQHSDHVITDQKTPAAGPICAWRQASPARQDQPHHRPATLGYWPVLTLSGLF